jgi:REP element-mobilizing transposase RayT
MIEEGRLMKQKQDSSGDGRCDRFKAANKKAQKDRRFILTKENRELVRKAILEEAVTLGQEVHALAVSTTHIHIVGGVNDEPIETAAARYKRAATKELRHRGITGKVWTKGFDKRHCFDEEALKARIAYVDKHTDKGPSGQA